MNAGQLGLQVIFIIEENDSPSNASFGGFLADTISDGLINESITWKLATFYTLDVSTIASLFFRRRPPFQLKGLPSLPNRSLDALDDLSAVPTERNTIESTSRGRLYVK